MIKPRSFARPCARASLARPSLAAAVALSLCLCGAAAAATAASPAVSPSMSMAEQRKIFLQAEKALKAGRLDSYRKLADSIRDYPLHPYLRYRYLRTRVWKLPDEDIAAFLESHEALPVAPLLRRAWLIALAKRGRWNAFLEHYTPQEEVGLRCRMLRARAKTGGDAELLEDIRAVWLAGASLPRECDPVFKLLYQSDLMSDELLWRRIKLAMGRGNVTLARFLGRKLSADWRRAQLKRWIAMHRHPDRTSRDVRYQDDAVNRDILVHGMRRLSRYNINKTIFRWRGLKARYGFSREQVDAVETTLAARAARRRHPQALAMLRNLDDEQIDENLFQHRLATALRHRDWAALRDWTRRPPFPNPPEWLENRRLFWHAHALHNLGERRAARGLFRRLSVKRDYYGFLAADHLDAAYRLAHRPLPDDQKTRKRIAARPAVLRAREFYHLRRLHSARREWASELPAMNGHELQIAAAIAAEWGWHDRAILTLGKAHAHDDLVVRFPLPYQKRLSQYAEKRKLNLSWMYALVRAESAFIERVRSPAGALGLMQVMPRTGRRTAKSIRYRTYRRSMLLEERHNITIGSAYLRDLFHRFNGNYALATAAYNAGPLNVMRWLPREACEDPRLWIEQIPFTETRKYVRRILYFASIYDWRLQGDVVPVAERIDAIPTTKRLRAKRDCESQAPPLPRQARR